MAKSDSGLHVLHYDDNAFERTQVLNSLTRDQFGPKFNVEGFSNADALRERIRTSPAPDIVILDIHDETSEGLPGIDLARETRRALANVVIVMRSNLADSKTIRVCLQAGADDFVSKKSEKGELCHRLLQSFEIAQMKRGVFKGESRGEGVSSAKVMGKTMKIIAQRLPKILKSAITTIHVHGESGTGKEVVVDLLEQNLSDGQPLIRANCGAIAPTLLESELFGHIKGAFTGATSDRKGLLEAAHGGWLFLDEVATLTPSAQVALLRAIENQEIRPLGAAKPKNIRVKVVSAANESLSDLVASGKFRKDLWQRLCDTSIDLPPLRERPGEIEELARNFCATMPGGPFEISDPALEVLSSYSWKNGNVRELRNCLRAMTEFHVNRLLTPVAIPAAIWDDLGEKGADKFKPSDAGTPPSKSSSHLVLDLNPGELFSYDAFHDALLETLIRTAAGRSRKISLRGLARDLSIPRSTLTDWIRQLMSRGRLKDGSFEDLLKTSTT